MNKVRERFVKQRFSFLHVGLMSAILLLLAIYLPSLRGQEPHVPPRVVDTPQQDAIRQQRAKQHQREQRAKQNLIEQTSRLAEGLGGASIPDVSLGARRKGVARQQNSDIRGS